MYSIFILQRVYSCEKDICKSYSYKSKYFSHLILGYVLFAAQTEEGISSFRPQNCYYILVAVVHTCCNGTFKIFILEAIRDFVFGCNLFPKSYFVMLYILLVLCLLLAPFLSCPFFSDELPLYFSSNKYNVMLFCVMMLL